jgi:hypothetical protein
MALPSGNWQKIKWSEFREKTSSNDLSFLLPMAASFKLTAPISKPILILMKLATHFSAGLCSDPSKALAADGSHAN